MGLLGLIAILVIPAGTQSMTNDGFNLYGQATMTYNDAFGNEMLSQTVHNQLFDQGEDFILANTFTGISDIGTDATQIGAICLTTAAEAAESYAETIVHTVFNADLCVIWLKADLTMKIIVEQMVLLPIQPKLQQLDH